MKNLYTETSQIQAISSGEGTELAGAVKVGEKCKLNSFGFSPRSTARLVKLYIFHLARMATRPASHILCMAFYALEKRHFYAQILQVFQIFNTRTGSGL